MTKRYVRVCIAVLLSLALLPAAMSQAAINVWKTYGEANQAKAKGQYKLAIQKFQLVIPSFVEKKDFKNAALMYNNIGDLQSRLALYDDAVAAWDQESLYWAKAQKIQESIAAKRKADWLRSTFRLYVQEDAAASAGVYHNAKYEPKVGAYIGAYAENDKAVHNPLGADKFYMNDFPAMTDKKHGMYLLYTEYGRSFFTDYKRHIDIARQQGVALQVALQPTKGLDAVQDDDYLRELARSAKAADIPIFLRFANEMNGQWVEWYTDPKKYIEKFRIVAKVFHEEADNVVMLWSPAYFPPDNITEYYPGDDAVDWVGASIYQAYNGQLDPLKKGVDRSSYIEKFDNIYKLYAKKKPIMLSEGGVSYTDPVQHSDRNAWAAYQTKLFYGSLPLLYPGVKAVVWFDATKKENGRLNSYMLSQSEKALRAYRQSVANPYYLTGIGEESTVAYSPFATSKVPARSVTLAAYIKTVAPILSRVEYCVNGKSVATVTDAPWTLTFDFTPYRGKQVDFTIKAFDDAGVKVSSRNFKLTVQP